MLMLSDPTTTRHTKRCGRLNFNQCGVEACSPGHFYGPRVRYHCLIHFVLEGKGKLVINQEKYEVHAGDAFLIPPNALGYYIADMKEPWKYFWLSFVGTEAEQYAVRVFEGGFVRSLSNIQQIWEQMRQLISTFLPENWEENAEKLCSESYHIYPADTLQESFRMNAGMYTILSMLLEQEGNQEEQQKQSSYAEKVKNYIDSYFMDINEITQLAQMFHLHPNYLSAIFKEKFYVSPKQYLLERKLEYANHLLSETEYSIQYISSACGFLNVSTFSKVYKRHMGVSPGTYRRSKHNYKYPSSNGIIKSTDRKSR